MRDRAIQSYVRFHNGQKSGLSTSALQDFNEGITPELAVLSGQTRLFEAASYTDRTDNIRNDAACLSRLVMWGGPSLVLNGHDVVTNDSSPGSTNGGSNGGSGTSSGSNNQFVSSYQTGTGPSTSPEASAIHSAAQSKPDSLPNSVESSPPVEQQGDAQYVDLSSYARQLEEYYNPTGDVSGMGFEWPTDMNFATGVEISGESSSSVPQSHPQYANTVTDNSASGSGVKIGRAHV